jgi:hypothetical protein
METELVFETLAFDSTLTRLIARENFITFMRRESIKSYVEYICFPNMFFAISHRPSSLVLMFILCIANANLVQHHNK